MTEISASKMDPDFPMPLRRLAEAFQQNENVGSVEPCTSPLQIHRNPPSNDHWLRVVSNQVPALPSLNAIYQVYRPKNTIYETSPDVIRVEFTSLDKPEFCAPFVHDVYRALQKAKLLSKNATAFDDRGRSGWRSSGEKQVMLSTDPLDALQLILGAFMAAKTITADGLKELGMATIAQQHNAINGTVRQLKVKPPVLV